MKIDFGKTAADYGRYRAGFPDLFFKRLFSAGYVRSGNDVLDLGTGAGTVARGLAMLGCNVTGLDPSQALIEEAQRLDQQLVCWCAMLRVGPRKLTFRLMLSMS